MATPTKAWASKDGALWPTAEEAARSDLLSLFKDYPDADIPVDLLFEHKDLVIEALTTGPRSKPKARRVAGTTNPKRAAKRPTPALDPSQEAGTDVPTTADVGNV